MFVSDLHCRKSSLVLGTMLLWVTVKITDINTQRENHTCIYSLDISHIFFMILDDVCLVTESRWISNILPDIFFISSLQKSSSLSLSWQTDSLTPSKEKRKLTEMFSVDSGGAERHWRLCRNKNTHDSKTSLSHTVPNYLHYFFF